MLDQRPPIDRRIAARRQTVREARARRRLRWLLMLFGLAGGGALVAWLLFQSSFLAVSEIRIVGEQRSSASAIVDAAGVAPGLPTVNVPAAELEAALAADPWIAAADVTVRWPGTVEITVVEHVPAAWVKAGDTWLLTAVGGAVLDSAASIPEDAPHADVGAIIAAPGDVLTAVEALAAIEFLNRLPADLVPGASVSGSADELRAVVAGFVVDLGYPADIAQKAAAVGALIDAGLVADGSVISVVSPQRPAVLEPEPAGSSVDGADASPSEPADEGAGESVSGADGSDGGG